MSAPSVSTTTTRLPFVARRGAAIVASMLHKGSLRVELPDGGTVHFEGAEPGHHGTMKLHRWRAVTRFLLRGDVGFGEGFVAGDWDSDAPADLLTVFAGNSAVSGKAFDAGPVVRAQFRLAQWWRTNTRRQAKRNVSAHYDLGNDFYRLWLDPTMTYSSALFPAPETSLEEGQLAKARALVERTGIRPGDHILEIGCGWGSFAIFAAQTMGCHVTALTLSRAQADFARERVEALGLGDLVTIALRDYRDETGIYDRIVSIEMLEAVGERYWTAYFETISRCLKPGGTAGLQVITVPDAFFDEYRKGTDFIRAHIFPGGLLPPLSRIDEIAEACALSPSSQHAFGADYARTLTLWRERFCAASGEIAALGYDEAFARKWLYYLDFSTAGFNSGLIDVYQLVYARER